VSRFGRANGSACATRDAGRGIVRQSTAPVVSASRPSFPPPSPTRGISGDMSDLRHAYGREGGHDIGARPHPNSVPWQVNGPGEFVR